MKLEKGMIVKFKECIDIDMAVDETGCRGRRGEERLMLLIEKVEGKITSILDYCENSRGDREYYISDDYFIGIRFPITWFEYVIPTIPIPNYKGALQEGYIVELSKGKQLLYSNKNFYDGDFKIIAGFDSYDEEFIYKYKDDDMNIVKVFDKDYNIIWSK